jgi:hypothetical protein
MSPSAPRRSKKSRPNSTSTQRRWSGRVTRTSNALDLDQGVFSQRSARSIALSLKRSAERSRRRKSEPFRSAMSMLNLYINRAGKNLSAERKRTLERTKVELRRVFHRNAGDRLNKRT